MIWWTKIVATKCILQCTSVKVTETASLEKEYVLYDCMHYFFIPYITSTSKRDHMSSVTALFDLEVTYWKSCTNGQTSR